MRKIVLLLLVALPNLAKTAGKTEILWDRYGVPHIFADSLEQMFYAHGWAQMQNQADLLLRLYGESRGRAAEYWGAQAQGRDNLALDRWVRTNEVPERAIAWHRAQDPRFRAYLDAFARGINAFAAAHPEHTSPAYRQVLPVSGVDVVGHTLRAVHYMYMGSQARLRTEAAPLLPKRSLAALPAGLTEPVAPAGSNTWAVGPSRSASGKPMLIINPHLIWEDFYSYMEVHLTGPGYDLYGAPQIGFPVPVVGFNRYTGWGRTVNTIDTVDFYRLTTRDGKYEYDGQWKDFERATKTLKIREANGTLREEKLEVRRSIQGPVVLDEQGVTLAMRVAGIDRPKMLEQWFRMGGARSLDEFERALRMQAIPMWHVNYADSAGHILLVFNGLVARRPSGNYADWNQVVAGNTSKTLWTDYLKYEELPKSLDPASGFHQNANEPPWQFTMPPLDPNRYPAYVAPGNQRLTSFRTKRSLRMISEDASITYDELLAYKHSTRMELADAVLPELIAAARTSPDALTLEAAKVLEQWDRQTEAASQGAVLFQIFADRFFGPGDTIEAQLRVKYDHTRPLDTAYGIADPKAALESLRAAAVECRRAYGRLDVPWGEVYRFARGKTDVPGNGGHGRMGVFRTMQFGKKSGNRFFPSHGETFVCAIEFGAPQRAQCALGYGNASQPGSPHIEDQLPLLRDKKLHPVWRERPEIEQNLEKREKL
ncbi:MAG: penicillin acylase family protein [Bryobacteraceae bacterium]|nr:penicillin acylase family protein [Bryobacteraceae bacterium]